MTNDPLWKELNRLALRRGGPRVSAEYGVCKMCGLPGTWACDVLGVLWVLCEPDNQSWFAGERLFDPSIADPADALDDDDTLVTISGADFDRIADLELREVLLILARSERDTSRRPPQKTGNYMTKKPAPTTHVPFDPWPDAAPLRRVDVDDPGQHPTGWESLKVETRALAGVVVIENDPDGVSLGPLRRFRARYLKAVDMGEAESLQPVLDPYWLPDEDERALWKKAHADLQAKVTSPEAFLQTAARKLRLGGAVLVTLKMRRAALDEQIAQLENRTGYSSATGRAVTA